MLPFFQTSWGVGYLNSAIFNSFHNRVEFRTILERLRNFGGGGLNPPPNASPLVTPLYKMINKKDTLHRTLWESGFKKAYVMGEEYRLKLISFVISDILRTSFMEVKIRDTIKSSPVSGLEWPKGFQEVKVPRLHDNGTGWW